MLEGNPHDSVLYSLVVEDADTREHYLKLDQGVPMELQAALNC